jgi:hypothetical protein
VVDEARILRLLRSISDDVSVLQRESGADESRREDPIWLSGVKYTFVTAIEACLDVAQQYIRVTTASSSTVSRLSATSKTLSARWRPSSLVPEQSEFPGLAHLLHVPARRAGPLGVSQF